MARTVRVITPMTTTTIDALDAVALQLGVATRAEMIRICILEHPKISAQLAENAKKSRAKEEPAAQPKPAVAPVEPPFNYKIATDLASQERADAEGRTREEYDEFMANMDREDRLRMRGNTKA